MKPRNSRLPARGGGFIDHGCSEIDQEFPQHSFGSNEPPPAYLDFDYEDNSGRYRESHQPPLPPHDTAWENDEAPTLAYNPNLLGIGSDQHHPHPNEDPGFQSADDGSAQMIQTFFESESPGTFTSFDYPVSTASTRNVRWGPDLNGNYDLHVHATGSHDATADHRELMGIPGGNAFNITLTLPSNLGGATLVNGMPPFAASSASWSDNTGNTYATEENLGLLGIPAERKFEETLASSFSLGSGTSAGTATLSLNSGAHGGPHSKHMRRPPDPKRKYECLHAGCEWSFDQPKGLRGHQESQHRDKDTCLYKCMCRNETPSKHNHQRHLKTRLTNSGCSNVDKREYFTCKCDRRAYDLSEHSKHVRECKAKHAKSGRPARSSRVLEEAF